MEIESLENLPESVSKQPHWLSAGPHGHGLEVLEGSRADEKSGSIKH